MPKVIKVKVELTQEQRAAIQTAEEFGYANTASCGRPKNLYVAGTPEHAAFERGREWFWRDFDVRR